MLLAAALALALVVAAPAIAQDAGAPKAVIEKGDATATAGGAAAVAGCPDVPPEAKAGDVVAKAECKPPPPPPPKAPPPPPPKAPPPPPPGAPPPPPKALPPTGGTGIASLLGLGAGALLVGGGLLARRIIR